MEGRVRFVEDADFLLASLDFGITLDDGIRELVDNALDGGARSMWVQIIKTENGKIRIIVADDGEGIPTTFEDDGPHQGIPYVMAFGGRIGEAFATDGRKRIGIFGFGLSQTITCLARKNGYAEVWSRNDEDANWRMSFYSYEDLVEHDCHLPNEEADGMPPWLPPGDFGTIVVIDVEDSRGMKPGAIQNRLLKFMGRTYRRYLADGCTISITSDTGSKQNAKGVRIKDPLALIEGSEEVNGLGKAVEYEVPAMVFDADHPLGEVIDPVTGEPAVVRIALSRMPAIQVRKRLGLPLSGYAGAFADPEGKMRKYGIGYNGQGFSVLRAGREIESGKTLGLYVKHNDYSYMHGEIDFPVALDRLFNVQTNKSRYTIDRQLRDVLRKHMRPHIATVYRDHRDAAKRQVEIDRAQRAAPQAEVIARQVAPLLPQAKVTEEDRERAEVAREQKAAEEAARAEETMKPVIELATTDLGKAEEDGDEAKIAEAQAEVEALLEQREDWMTRIEERWGTQSPSRMLEGDLYSGELYEMVDAGDEAHVTVNTGTEFWRRVYDRVRDESHLRTLIDVMLSTLGYAEFVDGKTSPEKSGYWSRAREEVSLHAEQFVRVMPEPAEGGEA